MKDSIEIYYNAVVNYNAEPAAYPYVISLENKSWLALNFEATLINQSVAPYNGRSIVIYYAFSNTLYYVNDAISILDTSKTAFTLPLVGQSGVTRQYSTLEVPITGNYLYTWVQHGALGPAGSSVLLSLQVLNAGQLLSLDKDTSGVVSYPVTSLNSHLSAYAATNDPLRIAVATPDRLGLTIQNTSEDSLYIRYGTTVSTNVFKVKLVKGAYWEMPLPIWQGEIAGTWDGTDPTGFALVDDMLSTATTTTTL